METEKEIAPEWVRILQKAWLGEQKEKPPIQ